ncbi:hypothetical protein D3C80_1804400 [compost metagenome]
MGTEAAVRKRLHIPLCRNGSHIAFAPIGNGLGIRIGVSYRRLQLQLLGSGNHNSGLFAGYCVLQARRSVRKAADQTGCPGFTQQLRLGGIGLDIGESGISGILYLERLG